MPNETGRFRGGRIARCDRWFGLEDRPDFEAFRRWWHRVGKAEAGGRDIASREQAAAEYEAWARAGREGVGSRP